MNNVMTKLPPDLPNRYRYEYRVFSRFGGWAHSYELVGAKGGLHFHVTGPHNYDGHDHWSCGLEMHSRTPLYSDCAPHHDNCFLLKAPCWHDGTTLHAEEVYLPMFRAGDHGAIFRQLVRRADDQWVGNDGESA